MSQFYADAFIKIYIQTSGGKTGTDVHLSKWGVVILKRKKKPPESIYRPQSPQY